MRVFIAGGTGLVGKRLVEKLNRRGDAVVVLTRRPEAASKLWGSQVTVVQGDPMQPGPWMDAVRDCDGVVNLVGEGIFNRRWSAEFKELLRTSRVKSTEHVVQALARQPRSATGAAKVLVNASAIGYYGPHGDEELTEASPAGNDTLAKLCIEWENAARLAEAQGVRVVLLRVGVVLDSEGGALQKMMTPFKMFIGGPVGSGKQYVSWIHHDDLVGLIVLALDDGRANGPLNGTAPRPVTNKEFSQALGRVLHRPSFMRTPAFALRIRFGEVADVITTGQHVLPAKGLELGYAFRFTDVGAALADLLGSR